MNKININKIPKEADMSSADIKRIALDCLKIFNIEKAIVEIIFIDKLGIQKLNKDFRQIDKPTDVLSFPQAPILSKNYTILGSVVINMEMVHEKEEEITDVIKHGLIHILGFDHETDELNWNMAAAKINCNL